jgi:osmotically inducible lipoprotein OsmB
MKKMVLLATALSSVLALAGCGATQEDRTVGGAALGAVTGGILGAAITGRPGGAVVGAVAGGATGAIIGANSPGPEGRRCARIRYDYYGNAYCAGSAPVY